MIMMMIDYFKYEYNHFKYLAISAAMSGSISSYSSREK